MNSTRVTQHINAPRTTVYHAFVEPRAVATWMVPDDMVSHIHEFEPSRNGPFRISLTYHDLSAIGKTMGHTDTYHGRFVELVRNECIVQVMEFETSDPALQGEMTLTITLSDRDGGTDVVAEHAGLPPGLSPADNELGWSLSLEKLARYAEEEVRVMRAFERLYKRQKAATIPFVALLIVGVITGLAYRMHLLEGPIPVLGWTLFSGIVVFGVFSAWNWRCPACRAGLGRKLTTRQCGQCGATLRYSRRFKE